MTAPWADSRPIHGVGVGLRSCHYQTIIHQQPQVAWFEILADNYLQPNGIPVSQLQPICERYPVVSHSVGLSLGSVDPINWEYVSQLRKLAELIQPTWISDHLCWISTQQTYLHELMPLPYTDEAVNHVAERIMRIQDFLKQQILIENVSSYMAYQYSSLTEWEFLTAVAEHADCFILLDINNIYVSAFNHQFDPLSYLHYIPQQRVKQLHLAGYEDKQTHLLDTHGDVVQKPVWELYQQALQYLGPVPTLIEWDNNIPAWSVLMAQAERAQTLIDKAGNKLSSPHAKPPPQGGAGTCEKLALLQQQLREAIFTNQASDELLQTICPSHTLKAAQRISIYRDSILANKINSLASIYPVCQRLVGEDYFAAMAVKYCKQTPAIHPDLNNYGQSLIDFIANFAPAATLPYLPDVARLEWAWHQAFNGPAASQLDLNLVATLPEPDFAKLCFEIPLKSSLLQSKFPIMKIWQVNQANFQGDPCVSLDEGGNHLIIWRKNFEVQIEQCHPTHWHCLQWFNSGLYLEQVLEQVVAIDSSIEIATLLPTLANRGWLAAMAVKNHNNHKKGANNVVREAIQQRVGIV